MADFWEINQEMKSHFVIGGDFNSKDPRWGSYTSNPRGKLLYSIVYQHKLGLLHPIIRMTVVHQTYWTSLLQKI